MRTKFGKLILTGYLDSQQAPEQRELLHVSSQSTFTFRLIGLLPADVIDWNWRVYAILFPSSDVRDDSRVRRWLSASGPEADGRLPTPDQAPNGAMLARCWPAPGIAQNTAEFLQRLETECRKIRTYADYFGWQEFPEAIKQECWQAGRLLVADQEVSVRDILKSLRPLLRSEQQGWDGAVWRAFVRGHVAAAAALLSRMLSAQEQIDALEADNFHQLVLMLASLGSPDVLPGELSETENVATVLQRFFEANRRALLDAAHLEYLLSTEHFAMFWSTAPQAQLQLLLKKEIFGTIGNFRELLENIFSESIRPHDFEQCRRIFLDGGDSIIL